MRKVNQWRIRQNKIIAKDSEDLIIIAKKLWAPLSDAESGLLARIAQNSTSEAKAAEIICESPGSIVRPAFLRWLCTSKETISLIDARGLRIRDCVINGDLDLESIKCSFPIDIKDSIIEGDARLNYASFPYIRIQDTEVKNINATRLQLDGSLVLNGIKTQGELSLYGADIGGNIQLGRAKLSNPKGCTLNFLTANIGGAINMRESFYSNGCIRILSAQIGKNLDCSGTIVAPRENAALLIESSNIRGSVLLRNGFRILGRVRIFQTIIEGALDMQSSRVSARNGAAVFVYGSRIKGSVLLRGGRNKKMRCLGGVELKHSFIEGHLDLSNAQIRSNSRAAADMLDLKIDGRLIAINLFVSGGLILSRAIVKNDIIFSSSELVNPDEYALKARGLHCGGSVLLDKKFKATGQVSFFGSTINDEINAYEARFETKNGFAVDLGEANIRGLLSFRRCDVKGRLSLIGASVGSTTDLSEANLGGDLVLAQAQIDGHLNLLGTKLASNTRLWADGLRCIGSLFISDGFEAPGGVVLYGAVIGGDFYAKDAFFGENGSNSINLGRAKITGHVLFNNSTFIGALNLELASIGGKLSLSSVKMKVIPSESQDSIVLNASQCLIGGDMSLDNGFAAKGGVLLNRINVSGSLSLEKCLIFNKRGTAISLVGATIKGDVDAGSTSNFITKYSESRILGRMDLSKSSIDGSLDLSNIRILTPSGDALRCDRMKVKGALDIRAGFFTNGGIDLSDANVGSYFDSESSWSSARYIKLGGFIYGVIFPIDFDERLRWLKHGNIRAAIQSGENVVDRNNVLLQPYEHLVQTLKRQGHERDARKIAVEKQVWIGKYAISGSFAKLIHWFYGAVMQYGYRPQRALRMAPAFLVVLYVILYTGGNKLMVPSNPMIYSALKQGKITSADYPNFSSLAYVVDTFVPILNLQQKDSWRPDDRVECKTGINRCGFWLRFYLWFHMAAGWIITTLAVAGFTGLVRKD